MPFRPISTRLICETATRTKYIYYRGTGSEWADDFIGLVITTVKKEKENTRHKSNYPSGNRRGFDLLGRLNRLGET